MTARLDWQIGTVTEIKQETPRAKTFTVTLPNWMAHLPGQHYDVRLTAPDGYQAQRSYSIASEPEQRGIVELTVELISDGEVSPYMHNVLREQDQLELRGPIGGYFAWELGLGGPLVLVGGGSGVVPLMAILRHRVAADFPIPTRLLYSSRSRDDVIYAEELDWLHAHAEGVEVFHTFTRQAPTGWTGYTRRIDRAMLADIVKPFGSALRSYVCGPTLMVEAAANSLLELGIPAGRIRTERFGPSGN
jgi:ferredoxin-NADP reductase